MIEAVYGGPLHLHIAQHCGLGLAITRLYLAQLISALSHMARKGCIHRDIKANNVIISDKGHIKLSDFGSSKVLFEPSEYSTVVNNGPILCPRTFTLVGTPHALAPEIVCSYSTNPDDRAGYGLSIDWWSLGVLMGEMLHSSPPTPSNLATLRSLPLESILPAADPFNESSE
jgi:serine/threonine protein kinase